MGTYAQWKAKIEKEIPGIVWVCGDERTLANSVVEDCKNLLKDSVSIENIHLSDTSEIDLWKALSRRQLDIYDNHLYLVWEANLIDDTERLQKWLKIKPSNVYVVLVSEQIDFPRERRVADQKVADLKGYIQDIQKKGYIVKCSSTSVPDLTAFIHSLSGVDKDLADKLLANSRNPKSLRDAALKLIAMRAKVSTSSVLSVLPKESSQGFVEHLVAKQKVLSAKCISGIDYKDYPDILLKLDRLLAVCYSINMAMSNDNTLKRISEVSGQPEFIVRQYKPIANYYDKNQFLRLKNVLAALEEPASNVNTCNGLLESLQALW